MKFFDFWSNFEANISFSCSLTRLFLEEMDFISDWLIMIFSNYKDLYI